jgi:hypothetical protein
MASRVIYLASGDPASHPRYPGHPRLNLFALVFVQNGHCSADDALRHFCMEPGRKSRMTRFHSAASADNQKSNAKHLATDEKSDGPGAASRK